jgi:hypothetical protein
MSSKVEEAHIMWDTDGSLRVRSMVDVGAVPNTTVWDGKTETFGTVSVIDRYDAEGARLSGELDVDVGVE